MVQHSQSNYKKGPCNAAGLHRSAQAAANIVGHMHSEPNIIGYRLIELATIPRVTHTEVGGCAA